MSSARSGLGPQGAAVLKRAAAKRPTAAEVGVKLNGGPHANKRWPIAPSHEPLVVHGEVYLRVSGAAYKHHPTGMRNGEVLAPPAWWDRTEASPRG